MALYSLFIKPSAGKELEAVGSKPDRPRIIGKIRDLSGDPRPRGSEKLAGYDDRCCVRQGNYRIVYAIDDTAGPGHYLQDRTSQGCVSMSRMTIAWSGRWIDMSCYATAVLCARRSGEPLGHTARDSHD